MLRRFFANEAIGCRLMQLAQKASKDGNIDIDTLERIRDPTKEIVLEVCVRVHYSEGKYNSRGYKS